MERCWWRARAAGMYICLLSSATSACLSQVVVIAEKEDEEEQVQRWHRTPSAVLICTHDKFRDRGERGAARAAAAGFLPWPCFVAPPPRALGRNLGLWMLSCFGWHPRLLCTRAVLEVRRGPKPKAQSSGNLDALQRQAAAPQPLGPAEGQAQQLQGQASLPRGPLSVAEMLREGASVVCVDEAHVVKSETVSRN